MAFKLTLSFIVFYSSLYFLFYNHNRIFIARCNEDWYACWNVELSDETLFCYGAVYLLLIIYS